MTAASSLSLAIPARTRSDPLSRDLEENPDPGGSM